MAALIPAVGLLVALHAPEHNWCRLASPACTPMICDAMIQQLPEVNSLPPRVRVPPLTSTEAFDERE
eukprot:2772701-Pyramimonas_sp.AAC.1